MEIKDFFRKNIKTEEIIDLVGGLDDIKNGIIRAVSEENFIDDPLRILRAFRFASVLGFKIEKETKNIQGGFLP